MRCRAIEFSCGFLSGHEGGCLHILFIINNLLILPQMSRGWIFHYGCPHRKTCYPSAGCKGSGGALFATQVYDFNRKESKQRSASFRSRTVRVVLRAFPARFNPLQEPVALTEWFCDHGRRAAHQCPLMLLHRSGAIPCRKLIPFRAWIEPVN